MRLWSSKQIDCISFGINIQPQDALLIKVRIHSRHSSNIKYFVYILVDKTKTRLDSIIGHTCGCKIGKRVVGCCFHVCMILWYFSYAQYLENILLAPDHSNVLCSVSDDDGDNDEVEVIT